MSLESKILVAANKVLENPKIAFRLLGGMSNYTYVVISKGQKYTVRILGEDANLFVWREEELEHIKMFEKLEVTNETIYFDLKTGIKISKYIDGQILSAVDYKPYLKDISKLLKSIHCSEKLSKYDYDSFGRLKKYESINDYHHIDQRYFVLKAEMLKLYETHFHKYKKTLTHGDSQRSNFIMGKDKLYIVDFEFSGNNDPYSDIAAFGNNNFQDGIDLLKQYVGKEPTKQDYQRLYFYKILQSIQWYLVALYKHDHQMSEKLKVPFDKVAQHYLSSALKLKGEMDNIE